MLCESCNEHEATFHIKEVVGKKVVTLNLCSSCAAKQGLGGSEKEVTVDLASLIYNLTTEALKKVESSGNEDGEGTAGAVVSCSQCGLTEAEFLKIGRLGCPECYRALHTAIHSLLASIQRGERHCGRKPHGVTGRQPEHDVNRLSHLEEQLARAVATEAYERAAELRDEICRSLGERRGTA